MNPVYFTIMESLRALLARSNNCIYFIFITPWLICACKSRVCVIFRSDGGVHLIRIENVARNNKNYLLSKLLLAYFRIFGQELWWKENIVRGWSSLNLYAACDPLTIETEWDVKRLMSSAVIDAKITISFFEHR